MLMFKIANFGYLQWKVTLKKVQKETLSGVLIFWEAGFGVVYLRTNPMVRYKWFVNPERFISKPFMISITLVISLSFSKINHTVI